jgi:hypothetical protein
MENFETRLKARLAPTKAKIKELIEKAKATNEAIDQFALEVKDFCKAQQEARTEKIQQIERA